MGVDHRQTRVAGAGAQGRERFLDRVQAWRQPSVAPDEEAIGMPEGVLKVGQESDLDRNAN